MAVTLLDLILALGVPARDNVPGVATSTPATNTKLVDSRLAGRVDDAWAGSEVLFNTATPPLGLNPKVITAFDSVTGTLTMNEAWDVPNGVPSGTVYTLLNIRGDGLPFQYRLDAVKHALATMADEGTQVEVSVAGGAVYGTYVYTIPAGIDTVHTVVLRSPSGSSFFFEEHLSGGKWDLQPGRKLLVNRRGLGRTATDIVLRGRYYPAVSNTLTASYNVQRDEVVALAMEFLTQLPQTPQEAATNVRLMQERLRAGGDYAYPNERRII